MSSAAVQSEARGERDDSKVQSLRVRVELGQLNASTTLSPTLLSGAVKLQLYRDGKNVIHFITQNVKIIMLGIHVGNIFLQSNHKPERF